jgi:hypothetical protein
MQTRICMYVNCPDDVYSVSEDEHRERGSVVQRNLDKERTPP